jgi:hypothetical protein
MKKIEAALERVGDRIRTRLYAPKPISKLINIKDLKNEIESGAKVDIKLVKVLDEKTLKRISKSEASSYLVYLYTMENLKGTRNKGLLNRIISGGGFINYARNLENAKQ